MLRCDIYTMSIRWFDVCTDQLQFPSGGFGDVGHLVRVVGSRHDVVSAGRVVGLLAGQEVDHAVRGLVHQLRHALRQLRMPPLPVEHTPSVQ